MVYLIRIIFIFKSLDLAKKTIIIVICSVGLYASFLIFSDISLLITKFQEFNKKNLFFIIPLVITSYFIRSLRWNFLLNSSKIKIGVKESTEIFFSGMAFGVTPAKIGEIVKSHILKKKYSQPISKTAPIIFIERYYDLVGIIVILLIGMWFIELQKIFIIALFGIAVSLMILSQQKSTFEKVLKNTSNLPFLKKYANNILLSYDTINSLLKPKIYGKSILYSITAWSAESLAVFFIFDGFGINLEIPVATFIFTSSTLLGGVSLVPGGVGITEGGMLGLLLLNNVDYTTSFSSVLLVRILTLWLSVIIGFIVLKFKI